MCIGIEKVWIVMDDEIYWNIMDIFFKVFFIFKCGMETGGFEEFKEVWYDIVCNKYVVKCFEIEC